MTLFTMGLAIIAIVIFMYKRLSPLEGIRNWDKDELDHYLESIDPNVKLLDVRDALDYCENHIKGSINIYIGRLPYVNLKELSQEDEIIIVASTLYSIKRAAKILHKAGFRQVSCHLYQPSNENYTDVDSQKAV